MSNAAAAPRQRGFALVIVLWTLTLITLVVTSLLAAGRQEARLQHNLRGAAMAEAAADGAVQETIFRMTAGQWPLQTSLQRLRLGEAEVTVAIEDVAGKVNPNSVPVPFLAALLSNVGVDAASSEALAESIVAFGARDSAERSNPEFAGYAAAELPFGPNGVPYADLRELRMVIGMTPEILQRLMPHLSLWSGDAIDPSVADPVVARALREAQATMGTDSLLLPRADMHPFDITATAIVPGGARFTRLATIRVNASGNAPARRPPFQVLSWGRPGA